VIFVVADFGQYYYPWVVEEVYPVAFILFPDAAAMDACPWFPPFGISIKGVDLLLYFIYTKLIIYF
jgi:hypothetical protein